MAALGTRMPVLRAGRVFEQCMDPQRWGAPGRGGGRGRDEDGLRERLHVLYE